MVKRVFISYRRNDTAPMARLLYDRFCRLLGKDNVFLDLGAIDAGENFEEKIGVDIAKAGAILVLIGKRWLEPGADGEKPRLWDDGDHVRGEVRAALQGKALTLPLLVDGASMPAPELLPSDISEISKRNAPPLRSDSFDTDADHIARKALGLAAGALLWEEPPLSRKIGSAVAGALLAAIALLTLALAHNAFLKRPISDSIGDAQTTILIAGVLIFGLVYGFRYGSRRRSLI